VRRCCGLWSQPDRPAKSVELSTWALDRPCISVGLFVMRETRALIDWPTTLALVPLVLMVIYKGLLCNRLPRVTQLT
jgi:hypothetical protein